MIYFLIGTLAIVICFAIVSLIILGRLEDIFTKLSMVDKKLDHQTKKTIDLIFKINKIIMDSKEF